MKFSFSFTVLGAVLLSIPICTADYASAWESCITVQGFRFVASVSTSVTAYEVIFDRLQIVTVTPFSVITPLATTITSTVFSTQIFTSTLPQITLYITSTVVDTVTSTEPRLTITSVIPFTYTTSTTFAVFTVPTSPGFLPIQSTLPNSSSDFVFKRNKARGSTHARDLFQRDSQSDVIPFKPGQEPTLYPNEVICYIFTEIFHIIYQTFTAPYTSTVTAAQSTSVITTTAIVPSTTFLSQIDATLISTVFETSTITETLLPSTTLDITSTTTVTEVIPIETAYAACAPNNFADAIDGQNIGGALIDPNHPYGLSVDNATTPLQCCIDCSINPMCGGSIYSTSSEYLCVFILNGDCGETAVYSVIEDQPAAPGVVAVVSNGNCGTFSSLTT